MSKKRRIPTAFHTLSINGNLTYLENAIKQPPDNRSIIFIIDEVGGKGKTQWTKGIIQQEKNSISLRLDRKADILFRVEQ